jgi:hypothetical protein
LEVKVNTSPKDQVISLEDGNDILVHAGTTGIFSNVPGSPIRYIQVDFKERCFYIDFDPVDNEKRRNLFGEVATMKTNVTLFTKAIEESTGIFFDYIS